MGVQKQFQFRLNTIVFPLAFVLVMWIIFWVEVRFNYNFRFLGIYPQTAKGLLGVLFSSFVHGSIGHLFNNSIPILILMIALFYFYNHVKWRVLILGIVLTGLLTWCIARPAYHIGASGVVYMLASFLFFKGAFSKHFQLIALSLIVVFLYGSLLWYLFPINNNISWEGHLSGFIVGFILAIIYRKNIIESKKYDWEHPDFIPEEDPFIRQFDEAGNFIENIPEIDSETEDSLEIDNKKPRIKIFYTLKRRQDHEE